MADTLSQEAGAIPVTKHDVNPVLYTHPELFRRVEGPFWRAPKWDLTDEGRTGTPGIVTSAPNTPVGPQVELIETDEVVAPGVDQAVRSADQLLLQEERRRRQANLASSGQPQTGAKAVHIGSPTHNLSDTFHNWADKERPKHIDGDPG